MLGTFFIPREEENLGYFIVLYGMAAVFLISPFSRSASSEVTCRVNDDRENYLVINSMVVREIVAALFFIFIGNMMELSTINFMYIFLGNVLLSIIIHVFRRVKEKCEENAPNLEK